uniref:Uncharacterized protein n=1 Tax=Triticum urartu TaxID=4572 RepID=A0A8R7NYN3_TRIUA
MSVFSFFLSIQMWFFLCSLVTWWRAGTGEAVCLVFFSFVFLFGIFAPSISLLGVTFNYLKFSILSKDPTYRENGSSGKEAGCSLCQSSVCYAGK